MKRAESYYVMATKTRRKIAEALFAPAAIAHAIDEIASLGHRTYRVVQELPFDLSDTDAAKALEIWLDSEEFHYVWRPTFIETDPFRPAQITEYPELVIMW
jgi:hypothetical protein